MTADEILDIMSKPKECPKCKSSKILTIEYGLPGDPSSIPDDVILGGCCYSEDFAKWHCSSCHWEWGGSVAHEGYNDLDEEV